MPSLQYIQLQAFLPDSKGLTRVSSLTNAGSVAVYKNDASVTSKLKSGKQRLEDQAYEKRMIEGIHGKDSGVPSISTSP